MCALRLKFNRPSSALRPVMNGFIDFDNATSNLTDSRFVEFLYDWHRLYAGTEIYSTTGIPLPPELGGIRHHPFIAAQHSIWGAFAAFLTRDNLIFQINPYFTHPIPLTDGQGRLVTDELNFAFVPQAGISYLSGPWALPVISARANGPLAWEFVKHMADAFAGSRNMHTMLSMTVVRDRAERQLTSVLTSNLGRLGGVPGRLVRDDDGELLGIFFRNFFEDFQEQQRITDHVIERTKAMAEMPFAAPSFVPFTLYDETLNTFLMMPGSMAAAQAMAQDLHNRVTLWLLE